ncbi:DUF4349 domain-containing protein [Microbacterium enclense]|uniref:DUF4349 domain-containing protein n=1 Tax=Microbacterium enclense TaxID=993073 RepID=A0A1G6HG69_9MICO|nr:DUF4349 domain-containing protein [Microbacterium enclense]KSU55297.1 hypothetical protein AS029_04520 [Microbacterium enclense]SDB93164.1 protein of unknown function [Microbacterium enclense]
MTTPTLPPLSAERADAIESAVFGRIADERHRVRRRRRNVWTGVGAAAAVLLIAAVVGPSLSTTQGTSGSAVVDASGAESAPDFSQQDEPGAIEVIPGQDAAGSSALPEGSASRDAATRDIVATGSSTVEVDDVRAAIDEVASAATAAGGYVESSQLGGGVVAVPYDGSTKASAASSGFITVRVPADTLQRVMDGLRDIGDVTATTVNRSDVTEQTVDLGARVAAGEASVARLTELMAQAGSVSDLITAESALAERQAQLDSDRQVLQSLESQVAMSSLSVQLTERTASVTADPAGFGDGLLAGWNGLVATLNGVVIGVGFLLPWIVVGGAAWAVVWSVRRAVRRRREAREG